MGSCLSPMILAKQKKRSLPFRDAICIRLLIILIDYRYPSRITATCLCLPLRASHRKLSIPLWMIYRLPFLCLFVLAALNPPQTASGWGQDGHRITAEIAERNLTPKALARVRKILGEETLAEISTWADEIRSDGSWDFAKPWHFISINDEESWDDYERVPEEEGDILSILDRLEAMLRDQDSETFTLTGVAGRANSGLKPKHEKEVTHREGTGPFRPLRRRPPSTASRRAAGRSGRQSHPGGMVWRGRNPAPHLGRRHHRIHQSELHGIFDLSRSLIGRGTDRRLCGDLSRLGKGSQTDSRSDLRFWPTAKQLLFEYRRGSRAQL